MHYHYLFRPNKVIKAAIWLLHNSDLYKEEGIALYENWLHNYNEALTGDIETTDDEDVVLTENKQINEETSQNDED